MGKTKQSRFYELINIKTVLILTVLLTILMLTWINYNTKNFMKNLDKEVEMDLKQKVDIAYNTISPIIESKKKGEITLEEAREKITNIVRNMTYEDIYSENYIFMSTYDGYYLVQPFEREKEGTNMMDYQDIKGNYVIKELIKAAKNYPEGAYVKYYNKLPNTEKIEEKISYIRGIPEINAYIGTGTYLDSKNKLLFSYYKNQRIIMLIFTIGLSVLMILYGYKYKSLNKELLKEIERRKEVENNLQKEKLEAITEKHKLQTLFNNSQDGIVEFDRQGKILNVNNSFEKIFDYKKEEILDKDIDEIIVPLEKYQEAKKLTNETLEEGIINAESIRYKKDKTQVNVLIRSVHIKENDKVIGGYGIYTNITQSKEYEKKLEHMSIYDTLTGCYNYNYFENKTTEYKKEKSFNIGVIMADVNGLKLVNDTLGHKCGDELLKSFADILKNTVRSEDFIARIGGDEFVILLPYTKEQKEVKMIMTRISEKIERHNNDIENKMLRLSVALGCSIGLNKEVNKILKEADDAMYRNKLLKKESSKSQILNILMTMLAERDFITSGHTDRVTDLCKKIAEKIELDEDKKNRLILLAEVHDLGKVSIPDEILKKPGKLTEKEWEIMKSHTEKGYKIAQSSYELSSVADLILKHHERWDGKGYPLGIKGEGIPVECRILSIVDAYDAMTNLRPYNKVKSHEEAMEELKRCSGTQFDPYLIEIFKDVIEKAS